MNEQELKEFLKKHLRLNIQESETIGYGSDSSYINYTISLELDGERIGDSHTISVDM